MLHSAPTARAASVDLDSLSVEERAERLLANMAEVQAFSPLDWYVPLPHGKAFHSSTAKERWLVGANGSGKTIIGAAEVVALVEGRSAWWTKGPSEVWVGGERLADSEAVQRPAVRRLINPALIESWPNESNPAAESTLTLRNGWRIRFKATNQGREAWQGGNVALVWFDEEPPGDVFDEGFARTRTGGRVIVTFTPLKGLQWAEAYERVYMPWLMYKRQNPLARWGDVAPGVSVFTASTSDNVHLAPEEVESQRLKFAHRPLMLRARLHGEWLDTSEDAIVPMDKIQSHSYTLDSHPPGGWARHAVWIDSAFSKSQTSDRFCLSHAASSKDGRLYLLSQVYGKLDASERVNASVKAIREAGCPPTYVQRTTPDTEFAHRVNEALMRAGLAACVQSHPTSGPVPGKIERAHAFAVMCGAGQVYVSDEHREFKREAGTFPHAQHDDVFDSGMGALMVLVENTAPVMFGRAVSESGLPGRQLGAGDPSMHATKRDGAAPEWSWSGGRDLLREVD